MMQTQEDKQYKLNLIKALQKDIKEYKSIDVEEGYEKTMRKAKKQIRKAFLISFLTKAACIIAIPLLITTSSLLYIIYQSNTETSGILYTEVTASPGSILKTKLPDGSNVWLNSRSTIKYPQTFSAQKRDIELKGEAYFDVKTNPKQPFEVTTPSGMKIVAKGTAFNINAYGDEIFEEALLVQGKVEVGFFNDNLFLSPGEMITLNKGTEVLNKSEVNIEEKIAWKNGLLIFRNTPLEEVMKKLSRKYNVEIVVHKEKDVEYLIRATFSNETITQIFDVLKIAAPITWKVTELEQNNDLSFRKQQIDVWVK